jgi:hypothetical protein
MHGHATLCYIVVGGNLNSPLNLFISFAKALMEQGFRSDLFLAKDSHSEHGLMKAVWTPDEVLELAHHPLPFDPEDIRLMREGLANRGHAARSAPVGSVSPTGLSN